MQKRRAPIPTVNRFPPQIEGVREVLSLEHLKVSYSPVKDEFYDSEGRNYCFMRGANILEMNDSNGVLATSQIFVYAEGDLGDLGADEDLNSKDVLINALTKPLNDLTAPLGAPLPGKRGHWVLPGYLSYLSFKGVKNVLMISHPEIQEYIESIGFKMSNRYKMHVFDLKNKKGDV